MRRIRCALRNVTAVLLFCVAPVLAQARSDEAVTDGGGNPSVLESIFVPTLPGAPFTLTLATEWTRPMGNGGSFTLVNQRTLRRDSAGRLYQERWLLVPKGGRVSSTMNWIQIADPVAHTLLQCNVAHKECELATWNGMPLLRYQPPAAGSHPLADDAGFRTNEDLGAGEAAGLPVHLYRVTTTLNPGVAGNDKPLVTTREFSYSAALGINLRSVLDTPMVGRQQFTALAITTSEPEPQFFQTPAGYRIVDRRDTPSSQ